MVLLSQVISMRAYVHLGTVTQWQYSACHLSLGVPEVQTVKLQTVKI